MDKFLLALLSWVNPSPSLLFSSIFYLFHLLFQAKLFCSTNDTNDNELNEQPLNSLDSLSFGLFAEEIVVETIVNRVELDSLMKFIWNLNLSSKSSTTLSCPNPWFEAICSVQVLYFLED